MCIGQVGVDDENVGPPRLSDLQRLRGVLGDAQLMAATVQLQGLFEQQHVDAVVFDIEHAHGRRAFAAHKPCGTVSRKLSTSKRTVGELASLGEPPRPMTPLPCSVQLPRRRLTTSSSLPKRT